MPGLVAVNQAAISTIARPEIKAKASRKMDLKTLLMILLTIVVLIQILFMWFFVKKQTPVIGLNPVKVNNQKVPQFIYSIGSQLNNPDAALANPLDVAVDKFGRTYVADTGHNEIKVYNSYGQYQFKFGEPGHQPGQLSDPTGISIFGEQVYITEAGNQRISVFNLDGKFKKFLLAEGSDPLVGGFIPCGITAGTDGQLYVTDIFRQRVIVLDPNGKAKLVFGKPGQEPGSFAYPNDVAVDEAGNMYVSDSNNARVQVFDSKGKFLNILQDKNPTKKLSLPRGITLVNGKIFVIDTLSHTVRIMSKEKNQVAQFAEYGTQNGQLNFPNGIAVLGDKIFVADRANDRIAVFTY